MDFKQSFLNLSRGVSNSCSLMKEGYSSSIYEMKLRINNYFKTNSFESDLNELIELLQKHTKTKADFSSYSTFEERVNAKKTFLKKQALLAILASASAGATKAIHEGRLNQIGEYILITVGLTVLMIVVTSVGIIIKRIINGIEIDPNSPVIVI